MPTTADFFKATQWSLGITLFFTLLTIIAFLAQWGIRFRMVGVTAFMGVLSSGLFALSLVPIMRTSIPGAARYTVVYDNGAARAVIAVAPTITPSELEATLRQAANDLFVFGRLNQGRPNLMIQARTLIHPEPGLTQPLYLGTVTRAFNQAEATDLQIQINEANLAQLPQTSFTEF